MNFSLEVINDYLGRNKLTKSAEVPSLDKISCVITTNQIKEWSRKNLLSTVKLSVKYVVLNKIGAYN